MSVINTMLKDLEQRGGNRELSKEEILQGLSSGAAGMMRRGGFNPYLISLFSVLSLCAILALAYLYSPYRLVDLQQNEAAQPAVVVAQTRPAVAATSVTGDVIDDSVIEKREVNEAADKTRTVPPPRVAALAPPPEQPTLAQTGERIPTRNTTQVVAAPEAVDSTAAAGKHDALQQVKTDTARSAASVARNTPLPRDENEATISKTRREASDSEKSVNAYANAMDLFAEGRTDESRVQLKRALGLDASNSKASELLAAIYLGDDRPELAEDVLDKGLKLRPADQDLLRLYLQVQVQMNNYARAISIMEQRIRVGTPEDIAYLAGLYQKNNDHLGAARLYARALKMKPSNSVWWMGQGISFEALGRSEEAIKSYRQSIESGRLNTQLAEYVLGRIVSIEKLARDPVS